MLLCPEDTLSGSAYDATSYAYSTAFYEPDAALAPATLINLVAAINAPGSLASVSTRSATEVALPSQKILLSEWFDSHDFDGSGPIGFWGTIKPGLLPGADRWTGGRTLKCLGRGSLA